MSDAKIKPVKNIKGTLRLSGDKSISHRAVMVASLANGYSRIKNFLKSEDCLATVKAFQQLGVNISFDGGDVVVEGKGFDGLKEAPREIYLGNSGTSMRLLAGILAGQPFASTLTGDESLKGRPMLRVIEPLRMMGADIKARDDNFAPLTIKGGPLKAIRYKPKVASAQVKSAIIFASLYADGETKITEPIKTRDHTERMLGLFGARLRIDDDTVTVYGRPRLMARSLTVPGDISGAAFFIAAALILEGSEIVISDVLFNRTRLGFIETLKSMGGDITVTQKRFNGFEDVCDLIVNSSALNGVRVSAERVPSMIDELPILMVTAAFAQGPTRIDGAGELRVKETDRIRSMTTALKKMGVAVTVKGDDIVIEGACPIKGASLDSFGDHRTAMALVIASLGAKGDSEIKGIDCIGTSLPDFFELFGSVSVKK